MKTAFQIFRRDVRRLLKNRAATLVMIGVCLLPSLYAWFNIAANMDPYANTSGIRVAIANCDTGTKTDVITMNAGDSIVEKLKENKSLGWQFVSEEKAKEGVQAGDYYAAIVIPENFSSSLVSILSGDLKRPKLDYYVNEKKNAIAPKITDTGATTVQQQINDTFSATASSAVSEIVKSSADSITRGLDDTQSELTSAITEVQNNLTDYQKLVKEFQKKVDKSDAQIKEIKESLDQGNSVKLFVNLFPHSSIFPAHRIHIFCLCFPWVRINRLCNVYRVFLHIKAIIAEDVAVFHGDKARQHRHMVFGGKCIGTLL